MTYKENFKKYLLGLFSAVFASCAMLNVAMADAITVKYCCNQNGCQDSDYVTQPVASGIYTIGQFSDVCEGSVSSAWWAWGCGASSNSIDFISSPGSTKYLSNNLVCRPLKNMVFAIYLEEDGESVMLYKDFDYNTWRSNMGDEISVNQFGAVFGLDSSHISSLNSSYKGWCIAGSLGDNAAAEGIFECAAKTEENPNLSCARVHAYMEDRHTNHVFIRLAMYEANYKCSMDDVPVLEDKHSLVPDDGSGEPLSSLELCGKLRWICGKPELPSSFPDQKEDYLTCSAMDDLYIIYNYNNEDCASDDCTCGGSTRTTLNNNYGKTWSDDLCLGLLGTNSAFNGASCTITESVYQTCVINGPCADSSCGCGYTAKKNGYKINGWYIDNPNEIVGRPGDDLNSAIQESWVRLGENNLLYVELTANWEPIKFNIHYYNVDNSNNSDVNPDTFDVEHQGFRLLDIEKDGWIFEGWCEDTEDGCTPKKGDEAPTVSLPESVDWTSSDENTLIAQYSKHFYAKWSKDGPCDDGNYIDENNQCCECPLGYPNSDSSEGGNVGKESCYFVCEPSLNGLSLEPTSPDRVHYHEGVTKEEAVSANCKYKLSCLEGKWLNVGDKKMCLINGEPDSGEHPTLRVQMGSNKYYLHLTPSTNNMPMTCDSANKLHLYFNNTVYDAYDDLSEYCSSLAESSDMYNVVGGTGDQADDGFNIMPVGSISPIIREQVESRREFDDAINHFVEGMAGSLTSALESGDIRSFAEASASVGYTPVSSDYDIVSRTGFEQEMANIGNWAGKLKADYNRQIGNTFENISVNLEHNCGQAVLMFTQNGIKPKSVISKNVKCASHASNGLCTKYKILLEYNQNTGNCDCPAAISVILENNTSTKCDKYGQYSPQGESMCLYQCNY